jgi:hypothetical protein
VECESTLEASVADGKEPHTRHDGRVRAVVTVNSQCRLEMAMSIYGGTLG